MGHLYTPRPWMFTILFFILEMDILMEARRTGRARELLWLPAIFALWANVHIQFIDGLLVLGLAWAESLAARWGWAAETRVRPAWMGGRWRPACWRRWRIRYGWRIYQAAYELATQAGAMNKISELQAIPFRSLTDFLVLLLALASAAALAWRRRFALFETALLGFAAVVCVPVAARCVGDGRGWRGDSGVHDHRQREGRDPAAEVGHGDCGACGGLPCWLGSARCT